MHRYFFKLIEFLIVVPFLILTLVIDFRYLHITQFSLKCQVFIDSGTIRDYNLNESRKGR